MKWKYADNRIQKNKGNDNQKISTKAFRKVIQPETVKDEQERQRQLVKRTRKIKTAILRKIKMILKYLAKIEDNKKEKKNQKFDD